MANINHFDFKNYRVFETEIAGRKLTVETGKMAQLAGSLRRDRCSRYCYRIR